MVRALPTPHKTPTKQLLARATMALAMTIGPLAIITSIGIGLLAGQTGAMFMAGATGQLESADGRQQVVENIARDWKPSAGYSNSSEIGDLDLETAFTTLVETAAFRKEHVERATAVGEAWDAGQDTLWRIDLTSALREAEGTLEPAVQEAIASRPVVEFGEFPSPGTDRAWKISGTAAIVALMLLAAALFVTRRLYSVTLCLAVVTPFALYALWLLRGVAQSADPTKGSIGQWAQQRLQIPLLLVVGFGIVMAAVSVAYRPRRATPADHQQ